MTQEVIAYYLSSWPFDPVFGQREEVPRKPDPAGAMEIAKAWEIAPESILFVGDSDIDILTAQAAGMQARGVSWGYGRLVQNPVNGMGTLLEHPAELLETISGNRNI